MEARRAFVEGTVEAGLRVRRGTRSDAAGISALMDLNGLPRWVAYEGSFLLAESEGRPGAVLGAVEYRVRYGGGGGRLELGRPVVDPWARAGCVRGALYREAERLRGRLGLGRVVRPERRLVGLFGRFGR